MLKCGSIVSALALLPFIAGPVAAEPSTCDKLTGDRKQLAAEILATQHPYDCCDDTIAACLKKKPTCALAHRLAENICRRVLAGEDKATITRGLAKRARTMLSRNRSDIDLQEVPIAGDPKAPIALVEYACARCPFCAKITPKLHETVVDGRLKGKVRLYFKTFPIRNHEFSKETGLGFIAAQKLGRFWEFALYSYGHFAEFDIKKQSEWARAAEMDPAAFDKIAADPDTRERLVASKKEGIVNKVASTPTFFIDGRQYQDDIDIDELVDVLEEAYDRSAQKQYQ